MTYRGKGRGGAVFVRSSDLDKCAPGSHADDDRSVPKVLDLIGRFGTFALETVESQNFVSEQQRPFGPDEDLANPTAVPAAPFRPNTVQLAVRDPDLTAKRAGLALYPTLPSLHRGEEKDNDDQIDPEHGE